MHHPSESLEPIKYLAVDFGDSGAYSATVVPAASGKRIRVVSGLFRIGSGGFTMKFQSGPDGTDLTGAMQFGSNQTLKLNFSPVGHFQTAVGEILSVRASTDSNVKGYVAYQEV